MAPPSASPIERNVGHRSNSERGRSVIHLTLLPVVVVVVLSCSSSFSEPFFLAVWHLAGKSAFFFASTAAATAPVKGCDLATAATAGVVSMPFRSSTKNELLWSNAQSAEAKGRRANHDNNSVAPRLASSQRLWLGRNNSFPLCFAVGCCCCCCYSDSILAASSFLIGFPGPSLFRRAAPSCFLFHWSPAYSAVPSSLA